MIGLLVSLSACGAPAEPPGVEAFENTSRSDEQPIINGQKIGALPAVGAMVFKIQGGYDVNCTGTLIAPRKVVTAAHCIDNGTYYFLTGPSLSAPANVYKIVGQKAHPSYNGDAYDVGILTLEKDALETPMPMNTAMDASWVGRNIYWVGYGVTNANTGGGSGSKRAVTIPVSDVNNLTFDFVSNTVNTCFGDSGGPGFWVDAQGNYILAGLTSWGDESCAEFGVNTRVDKMLTWIGQQTGQPTAPSCSADGTCNTQCTTTPDPDCNQPPPPDDCVQNNVCAAQTCATPDPDCATTGEACTGGSECGSKLCVGDPQHTGKYCSVKCTKASDCPSGMQCSTSKTCIKEQVVELAVGEECVKGDRCETGTECVASGPKSYCFVVCKADSECGDGESCQSAAAGKKVCAEAVEEGTSTSNGTSGASGTTGTKSGAGQQATDPTPTSTSGCGCQSQNDPSAPLAMLLVLLWIARRRITRRSPAFHA
ncbi:MAG: trypsin-like serine protease [Deltaproteobacteria bacterium]|nr:trypsin-like serine protease [Deltaproteobacteria bacterium]